MLLACSGEARAQVAPSTSSQADAPDPGGDITTSKSDEILVAGSRASQQSANERKKNARTATDSIAADDIGSFPDRNVNTERRA